jgi:hypothetical protein
MSRFKMSSKATKKAVKQATESSGGLKRFKWDDNRVSGEFLILAPIVDDMGAVFTSKNHEYWVKGRPASRSGTPSYTAKNGGEATGEVDKIVNLGWKLRDKYGNSKNEKKKNFWQKFMLNTQHHVQVLDLKNIEAGPLIWSLPNTIADVVLEEIKDALDEDGDLGSICDFDEGRKLYVKTNGQKGKNRRYKVVKFKDEANLLADGAIEEDDLEEIADKMHDLGRLQLKYSEEAFEKHLEYLKKQADMIGIDLEDLDGESDDDYEDEYESDDEYEDEEGDEDLGVDEEDLNLDDEEEDEGDEEEEEELDLDDDEEELDLDEEELEEELEEEVQPKRKSKVKSKVKAKAKSRPASSRRKKAAKRRR